MDIPSYIEQGHKVISELYMKASNYIKKDYEVIPELYVNVPSYPMKHSCRIKRVVRGKETSTIQ